MNKYFNYGILFFASLICLVFAELGLRIFEEQKHSFYPGGLFLSDKKLGYKLASNFNGRHIFQDYKYKISTNIDGCFEENIKKKDVEILILGDSHTWGYVDMESRYSNLLRNKYNFKTYNCGLTGSGTLQQKSIYLSLLEKGFKPRLIILGYTPFNDIEDDALNPEYSVWRGILFKNRDFIVDSNGFADFYKIKELPITFARKIKSILHRNLSLYRYSYNLKNKIRSSFKKDNSKPLDVLKSTRLIYNFNEKNKFLFDQNLNNVKLFANTAIANNSKLIIATIPTSNKFCTDSYKKNITYLKGQIKSNLINIINNDVCLPEKFFYPINGHLNKKGHDYLANQISRYLLKNNFY